MKKYSIEDLRNGIVAVKNDGTLEELRKVLALAFPEDCSLLQGSASYYQTHDSHKHLWVATFSTNLPIQSVKDFLNDEFKYGDIVKIPTSDILEYTFISLHPYKPTKAIIVNEWAPFIYDIDKLTKVIPPLKLTLKEVAEKFGVEQVKIIDL